MFCIKIVYFCKSAGGQANWHHMPASEYEIFVAKNQVGILIPPDFYLFQKNATIEYMQKYVRISILHFWHKKMHKITKKVQKICQKLYNFQKFSKKTK